MLGELHLLDRSACKCEKVIKHKMRSRKETLLPAKLNDDDITTADIINPTFVKSIPVL